MTQRMKKWEGNIENFYILVFEDESTPIADGKIRSVKKKMTPVIFKSSEAMQRIVFKR